jgi:hypothetical protein
MFKIHGHFNSHLFGKVTRKFFKNKITLGEKNLKLIKCPSFNKLIIENIDSNVKRDKVFYLGK